MFIFNRSLNYKSKFYWYKIFSIMGYYHLYHRCCMVVFV